MMTNRCQPEVRNDLSYCRAHQWPCPYFLPVAFTFSLAVISGCAMAQDVASLPSASELKKLSVEELMNIEVTSVSRRSEKLSETASAIQVITREDIHRFGATRLPEALRLATNLEVAQSDAGQWSVSARGFNSSTANKLLVLIDGRTVYSPLFAGMFWDIQDVLLEDVERIEVISGPGGTLWGANAVNGVINIITRHAKDTPGFLVEGGGGKELQGFGSARYSGSISPRAHLRVYGKYSSRDGAVLPNGEDIENDWSLGQGGFRFDWEATDADQVTLQGDLYKSELSMGTNDVTTDTKGGNVLGRWSHTISEHSDFKLQFYFDRVHRNSTGSYNDILNTYDLDFQHRFLLGDRHDIVWGGGYRLAGDNFSSGAIVFLPQHLSLPMYSAFVQDEIALKKETLYLTIGSKVLHNYYTGWEFQPSARLAWTVAAHQQTVWAAISRAVRTPSRIDRDLIIPGLSIGGPGFNSEILLAYEAGYRVQPHERISLSLAAYYNDYDHIRTIEQVDPPTPLPLMIGNGQEGRSYGAELTVDYQVTSWWRLRAGYTAMKLDIHAKPGSTDITEGSTEASDPNHYFTLRSSLDLPAHFSIHPAFRYVSHIDAPMDVPGYSELDLRLAWQSSPAFELSIAGQNLLHDQHAEFGNPNTRREIQRTLYAKILWRF